MDQNALKPAKNQEPASNTQAGSAIIWILIMVALFAALSYAVSQGSRSGEHAISTEKATLAATEILDYASGIKRVVQELQINGCSDTEISFDNAVISGYSNSSSPNDESCHVFKSNGGGLSYLAPDTDWLDTSKSGSLRYQELFFAGRVCVEGIGTGTGSCVSDNLDLMFNVFYLKKEICLALNDKLGITNPSGNPPQENHSSTRFSGVYIPHADSLLSTPEIDNQHAGCFMDTIGTLANTYLFYQILIAR